ncbi:hypothetical protein RUM44_001264 [Polyplax serrata]|uniref:Uncharacterized protein n=1 Tax=Polyplax serrata TaxID=468196 RepID=A0ABR1AK93_POLSC
MSIIDEEIQDWCAHNSHLDTHILCGGTNGIEDESPEKDDNRSSGMLPERYQSPGMMNPHGTFTRPCYPRRTIHTCDCCLIGEFLLTQEYRQVHQVFFERANFQHMSSTGSTNAGLIENSMALDSNHKHRQAQGQGAPPSDNAG